MKKILLIIGILFFSFASAQQNDLFDLQKHIQGKIKESKIKALVPNQPIEYPQIKPSSSYILPNGNKVVILPEDNMPCVEPDMSQFNMPNLAKSDKLLLNKWQPGQIPNLIPHFRISPSK